MNAVTLMPVEGLPLIRANDDLPSLLAGSLRGPLSPRDGDILVVAQKIVSKAENRTLRLADVTPSEKAHELARQTGRDPRLCQVYLDEAVEVVAVRGRMVITRDKRGIIGSGSGVDRSNVKNGGETVVLLPEDPDASARAISDAIHARHDCRVAVVINDSMGRADRAGSVGMAIGVGGIAPIKSEERPDLFGKTSTSQIAIVDEVAAAASILMGQANQGVPAVLVRGVAYTHEPDSSLKSMLH